MLVDSTPPTHKQNRLPAALTGARHPQPIRRAELRQLPKTGQPRAREPRSPSLPVYAQINLGVIQHFNQPLVGKFDARLLVVNAFNRVYELRDGSGIGVGAPRRRARRRAIIIGNYCAIAVVAFATDSPFIFRTASAAEGARFCPASDASNASRRACFACT